MDRSQTGSTFWSPPSPSSRGILREIDGIAAPSKEISTSTTHLPPGRGDSRSPLDLQGAKVLITHPWMGTGGSEATTMWAIQAFQQAGAEITFVTTSPFDVERFNQIYGTAVDPEKLTYIRTPHLPGVRNGASLFHLQYSVFQRHCRRLAPAFDLCVSGYNLVDFGKPGVQLIGDYTWSENLRRQVDPDANSRRRHRDGLIRRAYLGFGNLLRGPVRPLAQRQDLVLANSAWMQRLMASDSVGLPSCPIVFPPVGYASHLEEDAASPDRRSPLTFLCLGRISREKRIESMIRILAQVRQRGFPVTLSIAGGADDADYGEEIHRLTAKHANWIRLTGFLGSRERAELLASTSFGIHARPAEAFGIAVAEMAGAGCLPFVPNLGGPAEIVSDPDLRYRDESDAVEKIVALLGSPELQRSKREALAVAMERFRPERFVESLLNEIGHFLEPAVPSERQNQLPEIAPPSR